MSFDLIRSLWRDRDISLVHSHTLGRIGSIGCKVAKFRRIPFIFSIHGGVLDLPPKIKAAFENPGFEGLEWGKVFGFLLRTRKLLEDADAIVTCNEREARLLREKHPRQRVITQAHGISAKLFRVNHRDEAVRAFPRIRDRDVLLCIGRLDQAKNQRWLIREAPAIFQRHPNALLVLLGACTNAAYGEELKQDIQRLGLEDKVLITGNLPPKDPVLIGLLQRARAVIVPSLAETFCIVIIEAWAAGAPVMCSRTTGAVALIRENHNGWLFDLQQPAQFHAALDEALSKPDVARSHVANATRLVNETFDADVLARDMKTFYETLIEEKRCAT